ncbi:MAG: hypothetical protein WDW36_000241 [Sanguina aurantia]
MSQSPAPQTHRTLAPSPQAFCAGGDVKSAVVGCAAGDPRGAIDFFHAEYTVDLALASLPMPSVALIDGIVMGGGVGVSIYCSFRIATERTVWAMPECAIGLFPDIGASFFLGGLPGRLGLYLGLTGARLTGVEVKEAGLATHYMSSAALHLVGPALTALGARASDLSIVNSALCDLETSHPPAAHAHSTSPSSSTTTATTPATLGATTAAAAGTGRQLSSSSSVSRSKLSLRRGDIQHHFQHDSVEAMVGSLERAVAAAAVVGAAQGVRESAAFAAEVLAALAKGSPLSQKVTLSLMKRMQHASQAACLDTDWVLVDRFIHDQGDFFEGVRAVLIDKDNAPKWKYDSLEKVPQSAVDAFFVPREGLVPLMGAGRGGPLWGAGGGAVPSKM